MGFLRKAGQLISRDELGLHIRIECDFTKPYWQRSGSVFVIIFNY